ncbi:MAG: hypothetical protein R3C56_18670 [Pirellulaceae bacterium]
MDLKTRRALNRLYKAIPAGPYEGLAAWLQIQQWLQDELACLAETNPGFADCQQAVAMMELVWLNFLPAYLDFHRDLLFHQEPEALINGFFLGRAMEAVVMQGGPWSETDRIVPAAIAQLNDYVGHRPVAVLEGRRLEPYAHEWLRPIPIYVGGIGATAGLYEGVVLRCMQILQETDPDILHQASFDLSLLEELAIDFRTTLTIRSISGPTITLGNGIHIASTTAATIDVSWYSK